ncbi:hypothetical protein BXZ70DRAFT_71911 [Cristinia sonorae]|uniref:F-box domain-containing protein n=1 Tax=Cristinia sonorae TaxID=1940300 RepID=A0A8K0UQK2_9AGAR|nr:hypothetical protein BXZ70DRAFT_71911 [Cristinia sonorae]
MPILIDESGESGHIATGRRRRTYGEHAPAVISALLLSTFHLSCSFPFILFFSVSSMPEIPLELVEQILIRADLQTISRCRQVSKGFDQLILSSQAIQYKVELDANGYADGPPGGLPTSERLQALQSLTTAWATMQPTNTVHFPINIRRVLSTPYGLFGDHFVWFTDLEICVMQIPSVYRGIPMKKWTIAPRVVVERLQTFVIDQDQDLFVAVELHNDECTMSLWSLTTGDAYTNATKQTFSLDVGVGHGHPTSCGFGPIDIYDSFIGVLFYSNIQGGEEADELESLFLYNWKTGELITRIHGPRMHFSFLTEKHLLLTYAHNLTPVPDNRTAVLSVIDLETLVDAGARDYEIPDLKPVCELHSPEFYHADDMCPSFESRRSRRNAYSLRVPFYRGEDRILAWVMTMSWAHTAILLRTSTIMDFIHSVEKGDLEKGHKFAWEDWATKCCGIFYDRDEDFTPKACGTNVVTITPVDVVIPDNTSSIALFDFASGRAKRLRSDDRRSEPAGSLWHRHDAFKYQVHYRGTLETRCPARRLGIPERILLAERPQDVLLGDHCIIIVDMDESQPFRMVSF